MTTKIKFIIAVVVAFACVGAANAKSKEQFMTMGVGTQTCAYFAKQYAGDPKFMENYYFAWAQGFMSSMNFENASGQNHFFKDLNAVTTEAQMSSIRSYCDQHPLAGYWEAVMTMYGTLPFVEYKQKHQ